MGGTAMAYARPEIQGGNGTLGNAGISKCTVLRIPELALNFRTPVHYTWCIFTQQDVGPFLKMKKLFSIYF